MGKESSHESGFTGGTQFVSMLFCQLGRADSLREICNGLGCCLGLGTRKHKVRFKNKLLSLDSTTISLCLTMFPWAKFRRAEGGVKAHVLLDHDDYLPAYVLLTEAKRSDVKLADSFMLNPGSIVAIDRGYIDYALFSRWSMAGVFFVTRLKDTPPLRWLRNSKSRRTEIFASTNSSGSPASKPEPTILPCCVACPVKDTSSSR
jgi:hypothetical protein